MDKILIIENEKEIAELERDYLNDYDCFIENDGANALKKIEKNIFDCYIVDIMVPKVNGYIISKKIREISNAPIILVSSLTKDVDKISGFKVGIDDYIEKPFNPEELVARVKSHIDRYKDLTNPKKEIIKVGDISVNKDEKIVLINNVEIKFTKKEFDLFLYFVEHSNIIISKEQILKDVWKSLYIGDMPTVIVHIEKIRKKIKNNKKKYIETIWGIGYRLKI